ncbi:hypothetical protein CH1034_20081 [Klebsiella pneumoniae]|nr:hypothetical protein SB4536_1970007 [Klebsiella pneumoniae subsp. pneumoniae T69]CTQ27942.1 hypothetical protein CH1034_20081 [Klebsiella pneumoniae]SAL92582.1 conserved hypothetical protein [Klebsiella pneumoniae]
MDRSSLPLHNPSLSIIRLALYALYLLLSPDLYQRFGQKKAMANTGFAIALNVNENSGRAYAQRMADGVAHLGAVQGVEVEILDPFPA